jgi:hypothetical protein
MFVSQQFPPWGHGLMWAGRGPQFFRRSWVAEASPLSP